MKKSWIIFLCAAMIAGGLVFAVCSLRSAGEPEVRNSGTAIQWKRSNETEWHDLVSLSDLTGAAPVSNIILVIYIVSRRKRVLV